MQQRDGSLGTEASSNHTLRSSLDQSKVDGEGSGYYAFSRGLMYRVQYQLFFSFPAVPHKPPLLHQRSPDRRHAVRQVRQYVERLQYSRRQVVILYAICPTALLTPVLI